MPVYMLIEARVKDEGKYKRFLGVLSEIIPKHGGRYLVRGGPVTPLFKGMKLERRQPERIIIAEFPSEVHIRRCFASPEYQEIAPLGKEGAETRAMVLEGYAPERH